MRQPILLLLVLALVLPTAAAGQALVQSPAPQVIVTTAPTPGFVRGVDFSVKTPGAVVQDPQALTGLAWALLQNGFISHSFTAQPGSYVATIRALGDPLGGVGPHMVLLVDGVPVAAWEVPPQWTTFQVAFALAGGDPHAVTIAYTNDAQVANPTGGPALDDRNLIVDWLALSPLPASIVLPVPVTPIVAPTVQLAPFVGVLQVPVVPAELAPRVIVVPGFVAGQTAPQINVVSVTQLTQVQQQTLVNNVVNTIVNNVNVNVQQAQTQVTVNPPPGVIPGATPQQRQAAIQQGGNVIVQTAQGPQALNQAAIVQNVGGDAQVTVQGETGPGGVGTAQQPAPQTTGQTTGTPAPVVQPAVAPTAPADGTPTTGDGVAGVLTVGPGGAIDLPTTAIAPANTTAGVPGATPAAPAVAPAGVNATPLVAPGGPNATAPVGAPTAAGGGVDLANATVLACDDGSPALDALNGQCLVRSAVPAAAAGGPGAVNASALNLTLVDPQNLTAAGVSPQGAADVECRGNRCAVLEPLPLDECPRCNLTAEVVVEPEAGGAQPVGVELVPGGVSLEDLLADLGGGGG